MKRMETMVKTLRAIGCPAEIETRNVSEGQIATRSSLAYASGFQIDQCPRWRLALVCCTAIWLFAATHSALGADGEAAVEAGRDALHDTGSYPWYDAPADGVRRIDVNVKKANSSRSGSSGKQATTGPAPPSMFASGDWFTPLAWVGIALLLAALIYLLVRMYLLREYRAIRAADAESDEDTSDEIARVEDLPVKIRRPVSDLLSEARRHYEAGNFAEAIVYYYSHQLVQLDRRQLIRLTKGKTNRQYLRELAVRAGLFDLLSQTVQMFEDVFFGRHALSREQFESVWRRQDEFDSLLQQAGA